MQAQCCPEILCITAYLNTWTHSNNQNRSSHNMLVILSKPYHRLDIKESEFPE